MSLILLGIFLLASAGMQRHYPLVALFGLALNIGLNVALIPRLSYNGSAIATVVTFGVTVIMLWVVIERSMPMSGLLAVSPIIVLAVVTAAVTVGATLLVDAAPSLWFLISVVAALLVAACGFLLTKRDSRSNSPAPEVAS